MNMKRVITFFLICLLPWMAWAQSGKYMTKSGHIYFISHTPIIDIDAHHRQVGSILDINTGELVFTLLMKSFDFTLPLAEEHFNENYVESHKYPKSTFTGKLLDVQAVDFTKTGDYKLKVKGKLTIHGVTRELITDAHIKIEKDKIVGSCDFSIKLADYEIKVPKIVEDKVAKVIPISIKMNYFPYN